jgi:hypothetical protein
MTEKNLFSIRVLLTVAVTIFIWALLTWDFFHGGVPSHHLLHRKDLPAISNWWSGFILPALTWFLLVKIESKLLLKKLDNSNLLIDLKKTLYSLIYGLLFGVLVSVFFSFGLSFISSYMFQSLFVLALFVRLYKAEYFLGFVIGMSATFGSVLPILIGGIITLILALIYLIIRRFILFLINKIKHVFQKK